MDGMDGHSIMVCMSCKWKGMLSQCKDDEVCPQCGEKCECILPVYRF